MDDTLGLVTDGARLAAVGMGTVFVFLVLLVWATQAMSAMVGLLPERVAELPALPQAVTDHARVVAIVAAAIYAHRNRTTAQ
jgi:oxaloacetate decarboxylase gamma subunit